MEKKETLRLMGALNKNSKKIKFDLFKTNKNFFDSKDKIQVKYEMLRAVQVDGYSITDISKLFDYSRETYYTVARDFELEGCIGLLDHAQGKRKPEKLQKEIVEFIVLERQKDPKKNSGYCIAEKVYENFHIKIHPRTIYKVIKKNEYK